MFGLPAYRPRPAGPRSWRPLRPRLSPAWVLSALVLLAAACGYRPLRTTLPGGARSVRVEPPDPSRTDEPQLSHLLATELCRQLGRAGIDASTAGRADAILHTRILGLDGAFPVLGPGARAMAAQPLRLRLELVLRDRQGSTLWRSGLVEVEHLWPLGPRPLTSEAARRMALEELAAEAARQAVLLLTM